MNPERPYRFRPIQSEQPNEERAYRFKPVQPQQQQPTSPPQQPVRQGTKLEQAIQRKNQSDIPWREQEEDSLMKSLTRKGMQVAKAKMNVLPPVAALNVAEGAARGAALEALNESELNELRAAYPQYDWPQPINQEIAREQNQLEKYFPTANKILSKIEKETGIPFDAKTKTEKAIELASTIWNMQPATVGSKIGASAAGVTTSNVLQNIPLPGLPEEARIPENVADAIAMSRAGAAMGKNMGNKSIPVENKSIESVTKEPGKFLSGVPKPRAYNASRPGLGLIDPESSKKAISHINQEASKLIREKAIKKMPIIEEINSGVDFKSAFKKDFGEVIDLAKKYNTPIDTDSLKDFLSKSKEPYLKIPVPHSAGKKILNEVNKYRKMVRDGNEPMMLYEQLRMYRSNNRKLNDIYKTSHLTADQEEYSNFLLEYNKEIAKSIKNTLPDDSSFVKLFEQKNSEFSKYQDAVKVRGILGPVVGEKPTFNNWKRLASNDKVFEKLQHSAGKESAIEYRDLARDVVGAVESIRKIPKKTMISFFPGVEKVLEQVIPAEAVPLLYIKKGVNIAQMGYGRYLAKPAGISLIRKALNAIENMDKKAYKEAVEELKNFPENSKDQTNQ